MTDKATPSPASADSVMAKAMMLVGALDDSCEEATSLPFLEAVTALRAEVERLAAQAAPTLLDALKSGKAILIDWPMEPSTPEEALELMDAMDAEYAKTMGKPAPDDEMAVAMRRVRHMACDLWAWQKEAMRANFTALAAAQPSQAPVVQAVQAVQVTLLKPAIWIESGMAGDRHIMVQYGDDAPFEYAALFYRYGYTDNATIHRAATEIAVSIGASEPVEERQRQIELAAQTVGAA